MNQSEALIDNVDEKKNCEAPSIIVHTVGGLHGKISGNESSTLVMQIKWLLNFELCPGSQNDFIHLR